MFIKRGKKGQLSIFIIIAIVIIISGIVLFIFKDNIFLQSQEKKEVQEVKDYIQSCLKTTTQETVLFISSRGGYFILPDKHEIIDDQGLPYYLYGGSLVPTKEKVEQEIGNAIDFYIEDCINLSKFNYNLQKQEESKTNVSLGDTIKIILNYPIQIELENSRFSINYFYYEYSSPFYNLFLNAKDINSYIEQENSLPISYISNLAKKDKFYVNILPLNNNSYILTLDKEIGPGQNITLNFGVKLK